MRYRATICQQCGAPLEIPTHSTSVTCAFCGSNSTITDAKTDAKTAARLQALERNSDLEGLDREWTMQREQFMVRGKDGVLRVPTVAASIFGGGCAAAFGVLWTIFAGGISAGAATVGGPIGLIALVFPLFGVLFVIAAIAGTFFAVSKARKFQTLHDDYVAKRHMLLQQDVKSKDSAK